MGQYARAQRVMAEVMDSSVACRVLAAQCSVSDLLLFYKMQTACYRHEKETVAEFNRNII